MHIFLLGATGQTGHLVLANLLKTGHQVTALARNPTKIQVLDSPLLHRLAGDVMQPASYQQALNGTDAVISVLGNGSSNKPTTLYSAGGQALLQTMRQAGPKKLITISSGGVQEDDPDNNNEDKVKKYVKAYQSDEVVKAAEEIFKGGAIKGW
ncbi:NAD(P)-dependent oxidoreductase [Larkinella humicola]|uniref:NAD(P)H-binding protein n=1 Tax=Larkinella humicola TaxID=2607654 RepID=A0A5N1J3F4_9BACT|nr:NAD(P)H-binding protein [Larkinella humicola]KAA9341056.1 NAD(P)H-binding protein [Larkinella humicola]